MGFRLRWSAVELSDRKTLLDALGMEVRARSEEAMEEPPFALESVSSRGERWYVVVEEDLSEEGMERWELALAASSAEAGALCFGGWVYEGVETSDAFLFSGGREVWRLTYDGLGEEMLVDGDPPVPLGDLEARLRRAAADEGLEWTAFEIPIEVTRLETGFQYDLNPEGSEGCELLAPKESSPDEGADAAAPTKPWWKVLFGRD